MSNIISYLHWRGDLSFSERPFNEVDNVVLSALAYLDFEGIVPQSNQNKYITIAEAADLCSNPKIDNGAPRTKRINVIDISLLTEMAQTNRYKNVMLSNYLDIYDETEQAQFSALRIQLPDDMVYISFRGTDSSILGWQEDFTMSYKIVPSQQYALQYLESAVYDFNKSYIVGGHSKGGNLAMFAAMMCENKLRAQIIAVYNNDGPGFCPEMLWSEDFRKIQDITFRIIPEFSVIGMLFEQDCPYKIVKSNAEGIMQHDLLTWNIVGSSLLECEKLTPRCQLLNEMISDWIENVDLEHREIFTQEFFGALDAHGTGIIQDIANGGLDGFEDIIISLGKSDEKTKKVISRFFKSIVNRCRRINLLQLFKTQSMIRGIFFTLFGLFFMQTPNYALKLIGTALFMGVLGFSGFKLGRIVIKIRKNEPVKRWRTVLCILAFTLAIIFLVQNKALIVSQNLLLGSLFIANAFFNLKRFTQADHRHKLYCAYLLINAMVFLLFGLVTIITVDQVMGTYLFFVGNYLVITGLFDTIGTVIKHTKEKNI